jgi:uncharacterized protein (DUF302 family)
MTARDVISRHGFDRTVELIQAGVETAGLKVISLINAQENLKKIGVQTGGNRILEVFNPKLAKEVFDHDLRAGIVPPIRIYIYEDRDGTHVSAQNAIELFSPYNGLTELARLVDDKIDTLIKTVQ